MKPIVQKNDPVLRALATEVPLADIGSLRVKMVIQDMKEALAEQADGIAIAAPQIGVSLQIFLVSGTLLKEVDPTYMGPAEDLIFINPVITKRSRIKHKVEEGCLSVRWLYGQIKRSDKVSLTAYDHQGQPITRGASGLLAQIFQHETDHLNGILFTDEAEEIWEMTEEEIRDLQKR